MALRVLSSIEIPLYVILSAGSMWVFESKDGTSERRRAIVCEMFEDGMRVSKWRRWRFPGWCMRE